MFASPLRLFGSIVRLDPLEKTHVPALFEMNDPDIWRFLPYGPIEREQDLHDLARRFLKGAAVGTDLPFTVYHLADARPIGMTRYLNLDEHNRSLEIGGTWYGAAYRGTGINIECKYLLLRHAFESLGCVRVQLKTDARNLRSQHAIEGLGAVREGCLRNHLTLPDGALRDSVVYSILDREWPRVRDHLRMRLDAIVAFGDPGPARLAA